MIDDLPPHVRETRLLFVLLWITLALLISHEGGLW